MNWKGRQMFGGGPSGIVQMMGGGMTPYPTHTMPNGNVMPGAVHGQGYQGGGVFEYATESAQSAPQQQGLGVFEGATESIQSAPQQQGPGVPTGPSMEQRIAQIAEQQGVDIPTVRARIIQKTAADQGLQLPPEAIQQYAVGRISLQDALAQGIPTMQTGAMEGPTESVQSTGPQMQAGSMGAMPMQQPNAQIQMQAGGMVGAELFEEGDSDINNALNTMASVSNPEVPDMPASNGMAMPGGDMGGGDMTMDQGPGDYSTAVRFLKRSFQDEIKEFVVQTSDQNEVQKYLAGVNRAFTQEVRKLKDQFNIDQSAPTEELLDDAFKQEIASMMNAESLPGMQEGGLVGTIKTQEDLNKWGIRYDIAYWMTLPPKSKKLLLDRAQLEKAYANKTPGVRKPLTRSDLDTGAYDALTQERRENAERMGAAARAGYSSTQSRLLHHDSAKKAGEIAETTAMDKLLADQIGDERGILGYLASANAPSTRTTDSGRLEPPADYQNALLGVVNDDPYQKSLAKRYEDAVDAANNEISDDTREIVQIKFAEQGEAPPIQGFQGKKVPAPGLAKVTWIQFYMAEKAVMMKKAKENNEKFPERGTEEYYQKLAPLTYKWLELPRA